MIKEKSNRIASIDVFRGLTILLMIFVNDVAGVSNIPAWLKHAPQGSPGMTFVDIVFPAFLFIVGLSIPFALAQRKKKHPEKSIWVHILTRNRRTDRLGSADVERSAGYINGCIMVERVDVSWGPYSSGPPGRLPKKSKVWQQVLKWLGLAILIVLLVVYRRNGAGGETWIITSWWGILGEIGIAYLCSTALYLFFKDKPFLLYLTPFLLGLLYIADRSGQLDFLGQVKNVLYIGSHFGTHVLITFSGLICGKWLFDLRKDNNKALMRHLATFSLILALTGYLTYGLYGIDKIAATLSWALFSTSICVLIFMLIYWLMDIRGYKKAYGFFKPVAANPLLAYLLHVMFIYVFRLIGMSNFYGEIGNGFPGIIRSILYTTFIYLLTLGLTKAGIRLKL